MKRNSNMKQAASVVTMDAGKFLHKINIGAASQISIFEDHVRKMGNEVGAKWKLVSLDHGTLMFEDQNGYYYHADVSKIGQGKIKIENIQQIKIVENNKRDMYRKNLEQLIESISNDDNKSADVAFNRIASQRFRSCVIPENGVVTTKDGAIRKVNVSKNIVDEKIKPLIVRAVCEACKNNIKVSRGRIVEAVFEDEKLKFPISELTRRKVVARSIKKIAESAFKSNGFQNRIKHIAGLLSNDSVEEAVQVAADFLTESQEFTLLNLNETRSLIENALATQCCFNKQLSEDVGTLIYRTNCRVNRDVIIKEWKQTARKTEFAPLVENVRRLESSNNFEKDYQLFLRSVFTEDISTKVAKAHMYLSALRGMKKVLSGDENNANILESLDEYISRLQNAGDDVDDATVMEIEELVASTSESLLEDLETLSDYDTIPEPLDTEPETFGDEDLGDEAGGGMGGGGGGLGGSMGGGLDGGMGGLGGLDGGMGGEDEMGAMGGAGGLDDGMGGAGGMGGPGDIGGGLDGGGAPSQEVGGPELPFGGEDMENAGDIPPVPGAPGEEFEENPEEQPFESRIRKSRKSINEGMVGGAIGGAIGAAAGSMVAPGIGTEVGAAAGSALGSSIGDKISPDEETTNETSETGEGLDECDTGCMESINREIGKLQKPMLVSELKAWRANSDKYFAEDTYEQNSAILKALYNRSRRLNENGLAKEFKAILVENTPVNISDSILDPYAYKTSEVINKNYGIAEDHKTWPKNMKQTKPSGEIGAHDSSREDDAAMGETGKDGADNVAPGGHKAAIVKGGHGPSDATLECKECKGSFSLIECMNAKGTSCPDCGNDMFSQIMEALDIQENLKGAGHKMKRDTQAGGEGQGITKQGLTHTDGRGFGGTKQKMDGQGGKGVAKKTTEHSDGDASGGKKFSMEKIGGKSVAEDDEGKPWLKSKKKDSKSEDNDEDEDHEEGVEEDQFKFGTRRRGPYNYPSKGRGTIGKTESKNRNGNNLNEETTIIVTDKSMDDVIARIVSSVDDGEMDGEIDDIGMELDSEIDGLEDGGIEGAEGDGVSDPNELGEIEIGGSEGEMSGMEFPSHDGIGGGEVDIDVEPGAEVDEIDVEEEPDEFGDEEVDIDVEPGAEVDEIDVEEEEPGEESEDSESSGPFGSSDGSDLEDDSDGESDEDDEPTPPKKSGPPKPPKKDKKKKEEMSEDNDITSPSHKDYDTKDKANKDGDGKEMRKSPKFSSTDYDGTKEVKAARPQSGGK